MKLKNVVGLALLFAMMFCLSACTDYEGVVDDKYEEWKASIDDVPNSSSNFIRSSSSNVILSDSEGSSSSIKDGSKYDASANTLTDLRDGQVYKTVTIGTQTWMAENLNYETGKSWCYENEASNCDKYGRLYAWSAVMDSAGIVDPNGAGRGCGYGVECKVAELAEVRGICPEGWHVPTNEEYSALFTYIGGSSIAGLLLKSTSGWYNSGNSSDMYGFSVLPAGYRYNSGDFYNEGNYAYLWSASELNSGNAWGQDFYYNRDGAYQYGNTKNYGQSLRCLKD